MRCDASHAPQIYGRDTPSPVGKGRGLGPPRPETSHHSPTSQLVDGTRIATIRVGKAQRDPQGSRKIEGQGR